MRVSRRQFHRYLLGSLGAGLLPGAGVAEATHGELQEGREWRAVTPPQPAEDPERIQVLEFFSYGCSHCARVNPLAKTWVETLPEDVSFARVPVTFGRAAWENLARLYYALEFSGELDNLDQPVFDAVIQEHARLYKESDMLEWVEKKGLDPEQFAAIFNGFGVETKIGRAKVLAERYQINGVPTFAVGGRYVVLSSGAESYEALFDIADVLIGKAREQMTA